MGESHYTYLDYAATAPLRPEAARIMHSYAEMVQADPFYDANANSLHSPGRDAFMRMEVARSSMAAILRCRPHELIYTAGATEADNAALEGIARAAAARRNISLPHIVTTTIEHDAVFMMARALQSQGIAQVTYVSPDKSGHISTSAIEAAMSENTVLVSVIAAHNEIGALQDIAAIGELTHKHGAFFHADMVQALGKMRIELAEMPVDAASFSAHKIGGPKGVGLLYLKTGTPFTPYALGGGQESGKRSGTQNVCGIEGFAAALKATCGNAEALAAECTRLRSLRDKLYQALLAYEGVFASVPCEPDSCAFLPNIVNVCVEGFESETLILQCDLRGIGVSGGSACSSHSLEPSRTLLELGIDRDRALGSLRLSLGWRTTEEDIAYFLGAFKDIIEP